MALFFGKVIIMENFTKSFLLQRKIIGIAGILLPIISVFHIFENTNFIRESLSSYYHTNIRDLFVGILCIIGIFLISYRGYDKRDNWCSSIAGIAAILTAFFPVKNEIDLTYSFLTVNGTISNILHLVFAAIFFIALSYMSFFLFTLGKDKIRNIIYKISGIIMFSFMIFFSLVYWLFPEFSIATKFTFICETIMVFSFGTSWLIKGKFLTSEKL
jgi:hypothetical protein